MAQKPISKSMVSDSWIHWENLDWKKWQFLSGMDLDRVSIFGSVLTDVPPLRQGVVHVVIVTILVRRYLYWGWTRSRCITVSQIYIQLTGNIATPSFANVTACLWLRIPLDAGFSDKYHVSPLSILEPYFVVSLDKALYLHMLLLTQM